MMGFSMPHTYCGNCGRDLGFDPLDLLFADWSTHCGCTYTPKPPWWRLALRVLAPPRWKRVGCVEAPRRR